MLPDKCPLCSQSVKIIKRPAEIGTVSQYGHCSASGVGSSHFYFNSSDTDLTSVDVYELTLIHNGDRVVFASSYSDQDTILFSSYDPEKYLLKMDFFVPYHEVESLAVFNRLIKLLVFS